MALAGKKGLLSWNSKAIANINEWSADLDTSMLETTSWSTGTDQWRTFAAGLSGAAFTFNGFLDPTSTSIVDIQTDVITPASRAVKLEIDKDGGGAYTGTAFLERWSARVNIDGISEVSGSGRFTGAVTYSTTT